MFTSPAILGTGSDSLGSLHVRISVFQKTKATIGRVKEVERGPRRAVKNILHKLPTL